MNKEFKVGDELSPDDIKVGMIVDLLPYNQIKNYPTLKDVEVKSLQPPFGIVVVYKSTDWFIDLIGDYCVRFKSEPPVTTTQPCDQSFEQSIEEAIKTLSRASQELSTHVTVDGKGVVTVYSDYHEERLVFDTAEKLVQYMECVKQRNSFLRIKYGQRRYNQKNIGRFKQSSY